MSEPERKTDYNFTLLSQSVTITEMTSTESQENSSGNGNGSGISESNILLKKKYFVEEPMDQFDYIFEPEHYKSTKESINESNLNDVKVENKFTHARVVSENDDGFLEYEYQSYTYVNKNYSDSKNKEMSQEDEIESNCSDFNIMHHHLDAIVRGISLSKWPEVGYGFNLSKQAIDNETIFYVSDIVSNSPAEFSLQLGDILLEVDDINAADHEMDDLMKYINEKMSDLHLMVVHESKYFRLKSETHDDLLKDFHKNCEDIVIVSHNQNKKSVE